MLKTNKIYRAIRLATITHEVHQKQRRKGKDIPYIIHPLTVGLILAHSGADEDTVVAGILHDTIEDSIPEQKVSREMLSKLFGNNVASLVDSVTEPNKNLSWEERKKDALEKVKTFSHSSLLIKSSDVISNVSEIIEDYEQDGDNVFARFNAPKQKIIQHYLRLITGIAEKWSNNPLIEDLLQLARKLQLIGVWDFMAKHHAQTIEYASYSKDMPLQCPICDWKGTPQTSERIEYHDDVMDVSCPNCEKMLLVVSYPLIKNV